MSVKDMQKYLEENADPHGNMELLSFVTKTEDHKLELLERQREGHKQMVKEASQVQALTT